VRLSSDACRDRFAGASVARLATVGADDRPHLVPITFAMLDAGRIVTAIDHKPKSTANLKRLRNIEADPSVSVLADHYSDDWSELWWVRADGHATIAESGDDWARAIDALRAKYAQYRDDPPDGPVIDIAVDAWTGWSAAEPLQ
jgi:PPOX class probable F420-dependent enzyme